MKVKTLFFPLLILVIIATIVMSFRTPKASKTTQYMHVNVLESTISGGTGRSRVIITDASGNTKDMLKIKNYYSLTGVNFNNIAKNDKALIILLNQLAKGGWAVVSTTSAVAASGESGGIFTTKYLLKKE